MQASRRIALALMAAAVLAGSAATATGAAAAPPANPPVPVVNLLASTLTPSVPTDPVLNGVTAGSAPWVLKAGAFQLLSNGTLTAAVAGLIIPELGTPGPVTSIDASVYCGKEATAAATTATVPLSEKGNAVIATKVTLPKSCLTPIVLINPLGISSIYIATSGFEETSAIPSLAIPLLTSALAPSIPSDPVLHGVTAGSAPWVLKASAFQLLSNGVFAAAINGLIIPELGTPGPVTSVDASLYCGNETTAAATTATVPLSEKGNAVIATKVSLPKNCQAPVVLINPLGISSIYIATGGFSS
jgi:hypothetical protein